MFPKNLKVVQCLLREYIRLILIHLYIYIYISSIHIFISTSYIRETYE